MGDAAGDVDWAVSVDSTVDRAHQHATNLPRAEIPTGAISELREQVRGPRTRSLIEPADLGMGRSRGGLSTEVHQEEMTSGSRP
jgi:hypothetical protein